MPVRCNHCNRTGLPVLPGSSGGNGTLAFPVAHVKSTYDVKEPIAPCFAGVSRISLAQCVDDTETASAISKAKEEIWNTEALWEL